MATKKKTTIRESISKMTKMSERLPKTINEAINFNEEENLDDMDMMTEPGMENAPVEKPMHDNGSEMDVMAFIDDIRKKSLKGMAQLADNPDDERYQLLKKIWQICDKKPESNNPAAQPHQSQPQQHPQQEM